MSEAIQTTDVRAIVRLLGEIAILPGDISAKRRFIAEGLARLIDADVWAWSLGRASADSLPAIFWFMDGGWTSEDQKQIAMRANFAPEAKAMNDLVVVPGPTHWTRTRDQFLPDQEWYASKFFKLFREPAQLDDFLYTLYPMPRGVHSVISFHRHTGKSPFTARERCIVHVVTKEIEWLHREGSNVPAFEQVIPLAPRLRQVLLMLLAGDGRKQIANKLKLSEHTIADYCKSLHKHFNVSSRAELLAKFIAGGERPDDRAADAAND